MKPIDKKRGGMIMPKSKKTLWKILTWIIGLGICAALLFTNNYIALIMCFICLYAISVSGLDILFGYTGQISFGHAGFYAIGAYASAIFTMRLGIPVMISIILGSILAMVFGCLIAIPASKLVKHFLSLLTIAFGQMVFMFFNSNRALAGGASGMKDIPPISLFGVVLKGPVAVFPLAFILLIIVLVLKKNLIDSRVGRAFIAIRENTVAAYGMGINVRKYKVIAFAISAFLTGLSGALYGHLVGFVSPDTFNSTQSTLFITILLFGGLGSLAGPVIGSVILLFTKELMQSFSNYQMLVYAVFIMIVLFLLPTGLVGLIQKASAWISKLTARRENNVKA